jgi:putative endonuclease
MILSKDGKRSFSYVGYTTNLVNRLALHNISKGAKFTRGRKWKYIYIKKYNSKSLAMKNEYLLKKDIKKRNSIKSKFI